MSAIVSLQRPKEFGDDYSVAERSPWRRRSGKQRAHRTNDFSVDNIQPDGSDIGQKEPVMGLACAWGRRILSQRRYNVMAGDLANCRAAIGLCCILHEKASCQYRYIVEFTDELHGEIRGMFYAVADLELTGFSFESALNQKPVR
ncbi:hypothetical protein [Pseudomonas fluorescens]|uniref:hypothetical protein n=1 Tax=Pseudomonas fluorescens TaxID=294 RepID=UPI001242C58A|nr:hypothetical protein [Pseudomonas fluorescens]